MDTKTNITLLPIMYDKDTQLEYIINDIYTITHCKRIIGFVDADTSTLIITKTHANTFNTTMFCYDLQIEHIKTTSFNINHACKINGIIETIEDIY